MFGYFHQYKVNFVLSDWTNSIIADTDKRDLYIGVVGKDLNWLESSAVPLVE